MKIISRKEAKILGLKIYFTGKSCKNGHLCEKWVNDYSCIECRKQYSSKEEKKQYNKNYHIENIKRNNICCKIWYKNNKNKKRQYNREYWRNNREKITRDLGYSREWMKEWRNNTPQGQLWRLCTDTARGLNIGSVPFSKSNLIKYTPDQYKNHLLEKLLMFRTIKEAKTVNYHLDHIVPLSYIAKNIKSKKLQFCVAMDLQNLRLIPAEDNKSKFNRVDFPEVQEMIEYLWEKYDINNRECIDDRH